MFAIIGVVVVLGCVVGGFILEGGHVAILFQPIEMLIIGGAAVGSFFISSPKSVIFGTIKSSFKVITHKEPSKDDNLELLTVLFELATMIRRGGIVSIEPHVNKPESSSVFNKSKFVSKNHHLRDFIADNFKVMLAGSIEGHVFDAIMSTDIDTQAHHLKLPSHAISKLADALPGLGIVAAVLGVVLTMGKLNEPPEVLGHSIGAALLGTFLGVLMCYGFVGPMAANLDHQAKSEASLLQAAKEAILGIAQDLPPVIAVDAGRRALAEGRPSMEEMEEAFKRVPK